jgi:hypothetical protein
MGVGHAMNFLGFIEKLKASGPFKVRLFYPFLPPSMSTWISTNGPGNFHYEVNFKDQTGYTMKEGDIVLVGKPRPNRFGFIEVNFISMFSEEGDEETGPDLKNSVNPNNTHDILSEGIVPNMNLNRIFEKILREGRLYRGISQTYEFDDLVKQYAKKPDWAIR